jgi:hypothetical protein
MIITTNKSSFISLTKKAKRRLLMNKRAQFLYQLTGTILCRTLCQASPPSKYAGQAYYKLKITQANQTTKTLQVFKDKLANPQL